MRLATFACLASLLAVPAFGQPIAMQAMHSPADTAMAQGMKNMQSKMSAAPMTGNADKDFVAMMLPHHEGAVAMAKVELHYGKDPAMRALARDIIAAQDREIVEMRAWQVKH